MFCFFFPLKFKPMQNKNTCYDYDAAEKADIWNIIDMKVMRLACKLWFS